jgi:hypothetical protein
VTWLEAGPVQEFLMIARRHLPTTAM